MKVYSCNLPAYPNNSYQNSLKAQWYDFTKHNDHWYQRKRKSFFFERIIETNKTINMKFTLLTNNLNVLRLNFEKEKKVKKLLECCDNLVEQYPSALPKILNNREAIYLWIIIFWPFSLIFQIVSLEKFHGISGISS